MNIIIYSIIRIISYFFILMIGLVVLTIFMTIYFSYYWIKRGIYNQSYYISVIIEEVDKIQQWID